MAARELTLWSARACFKCYKLRLKGMLSAHVTVGEKCYAYVKFLSYLGSHYKC